MGLYRKFAATNKPDTCLWCGSGLRRKAWVERKASGVYAPPSKCAYCEGRKFTKTEDPQQFRCTACNEESFGSQRRKIVSREYVYEKRGDYGDGFFCGLRCAYAFGVRMAELGKRFNPVEDSSHAP